MFLSLNYLNVLLTLLFVYVNYFLLMTKGGVMDSI